MADLEAPEGVTIQAEANDVIARVLAPRVEEVVVTEAPSEGVAEAAAEGAAEAAAEG